MVGEVQCSRWRMVHRQQDFFEHLGQTLGVDHIRLGGTPHLL
jgi:hypothetical protein